MWRVMIKNIGAHRARLIRTAIAIVLGVAFVSGTFVLTDTLGRVFDNIVMDSTAGTDVQVRGAGFQGTSGQQTRPPIDESIIASVRDVPGVRAAWGMVMGFAQLIGHDGEPVTSGMAPTFGMSWGESPTVTIREGRPPNGPGELAVDAATAKREGFRVGEHVGVLLGGPVRTFTLAGIVGFGQADNLAGATMTLFELPTAQAVFGKKGLLDWIEVARRPDVPARELRARIAAVLPDEAQAVTIDKVQQEGKDTFHFYLGFFETALLVFALIALFVGAFVIFNTFSIIVAQRTRDFALLRSLGASPRQVMGAVLGEALAVGLVASAIGLGLGIGLAAGLRSLIAAFGMSLPSGGLVFSPRTAIVAMVVGLVVTLVSAYTPGRRAARVPPLAAMREVGGAAPAAIARRTVLGAVLSALGVGVLLTGLFGGVDKGLAFVGGGALLIFVGAGALSAALARPLARVLGAALPRLVGVSGKLARDNAMRNRKRTATTASALMVGVALIAFVAIFSASMKASATGALERSVHADAILSGGVTAGPMTSISPVAAKQLARDPAIGVASPVRVGEWHRPGSSSMQFVSAVDPNTIARVVDLQLGSGSIDALRMGGVLLSDTTAEDLGVKAGDSIRMQFPVGPATTVGVGGTYASAAAMAVGGDYVVSLATFEWRFPQSNQRDWRVYVTAPAGGSVAAMRTAVDRTVRAYPNVEVMTEGELIAANARQIDMLMGLIQALLGLAVVIAVIGIANTLGMSIMERTRELGLLRAVGMSRRQMRSMVRWEAVIIALIGSLLGLAIGAFFGWAVVLAMRDVGITDFRMPGIQLAVALVLAGMAGVIAAMMPARRAARLDVLRAIAAE